MSFLNSIASSKRKRGRRTVLCGTGGVGKTTAASKWPKPILLATEDGASDLDIPAFFNGRPAKDYSELMGPIMELGGPQAEFDFKTLIIDSADWAEKIFQAHVAKSNNVESLADIKDDFGKSTNKADDLFASMLKALDHLAEAKGMHIVVTCHAGSFKFEDPSGSSYDITGAKLHTNKKGEGAGATFFEWADEFFFLRQPVHRVQENEGFNKKRTVAVADGSPMFFTSPEPAMRAKCRMPDIPPSFARDHIIHYIAKLDGASEKPAPKSDPPAKAESVESPKKGNIEGEIVNGSSKQPAF